LLPATDTEDKTFLREIAMSTNEIVKAFFFDGAEVAAGAEVRIDVLDSWTNSSLLAAPFASITRCDGRPAANA
jgi:hypothetical protein